MEDLLGKKLLPPPPPLLTPYTSPAWLAPPQSHTNTVLTHGGVQDHMSMLPPPTFTHYAPLHAHPPPPGLTSNTNAPFSLGAQYDHMFRLPPPTFIHHAPPSPLVLPATQQMSSQPPALPAGGADSQELNLHSLSTRYLPKNVKLQPVGVLNGEIMYCVVPTPLNVNTSNNLLSVDKRRNRRVKDKRDDGRPYVKKPLNAFMLYLKELRPEVTSELNSNESVLVNRFVAKMWKTLPVEEKAKYFEKARLEQELHQQQHPGWSTNENYGKKRKRVKNETSESSSSSSSSTAYPPQTPFYFSA